MNQKHPKRAAKLKPEQVVTSLEGNKQKPAAATELRDQSPKSRAQRAHQKAITQGLRTFFDAVASEPVPDEFIQLLKKMDEGKKDADA